MRQDEFMTSQADAFDLPDPDLGHATKLVLWATYYKVHTPQAQERGIPLEDVHGTVLSKPISPEDWCKAAIEGTVRVEGTTYNYDGMSGESRVDCSAVLAIDPNKKPWIKATGRSRFKVCEWPFGLGVSGYRLIPFRTVAVDHNHIQYGSVLFIPDAKGVEVELSDGKKATHDGYFFAADNGGAIHNNHIDVFVGVSDAACFKRFVKSRPSDTFESYIINDQDIHRQLERSHKPAT
jgi:3D (Asp-Asp-Asp) domain-containing protein